MALLVLAQIGQFENITTSTKPYQHIPTKKLIKNLTKFFLFRNSSIVAWRQPILYLILMLCIKEIADMTEIDDTFQYTQRTSCWIERTIYPRRLPACTRVYILPGPFSPKKTFICIFCYFSESSTNVGTQRLYSWDPCPLLTNFKWICENNDRQLLCPSKVLQPFNLFKQVCEELT